MSQSKTFAAIGLITLSSLACGTSDGPGTEPELPGSIAVTTETSGFAKDNSYDVLVDGTSAGTMGANDQFMVSELDPATYEVNLGDVASNCTVDGITATVAAGETADATLSVVCTAGASSPYSLRASRDRPNLEDGTITECTFGICPTQQGWDLYVEFNSSANPQAVIRVNETTAVEIAHLPGVTLEDITEADVLGATFTTGPVEDSFDTGRVILIKTDTGNIYALGHPVESTLLLTLGFDAVLLVAGP
ncbi:MAG: hypothetical protein OEO79_16390 [Gemmatimonadota bacterium]|nr:hypothetical protein [Gemmatimonadota bacterium]MDH3423426.1 hypothetical protein [Gemmatimonadota bacterium]